MSPTYELGTGFARELTISLRGAYVLLSQRAADIDT
jgi:hypothetical protein